MLNKPLLYLLLLPWMLCSRPAPCHDFWVQPGEYWLAPGIATPVTLQVGHGPYRQRSPIPARRVTRFAAIGAGNRILDLSERLHPGDPSEDGSLQFPAAGIYVVVLQTDNRAQSHLPAIRFNDYLQVEGLTPALEERQREHRMDADGSEIYSRHTKAIVQVGRATRTVMSAEWITQPLGLPLEIIPEVNPYADPRPAALPVRVLYEGQPLPGALVKLTELEHDAEPLETHRTDSSGHATFALPNQGTWLLNVIWTKPLPKTEETDFETVFSSLSFGFSGREPAVEIPSVSDRRPGEKRH
jgi:uncharacterized GH25 family protein